MNQASCEIGTRIRRWAAARATRGRGGTLRACVLGLQLALSGTLAVPVVARADEPSPHRLNWNPAWPHSWPVGFVLAGAAVAGAVAVFLLVPYPEQQRWRGGILFDDDVRDALRARDPDVRDAIRTASDITLLTNVLQTTIIDGVLVPVLDHNPNLAAQLSLINAQAFAFNLLVSTLLFKVAARERPLISDCRLDDAFDPLCKAGEYASFPSSHTSTAFTAAGLTCITHDHLPLYGGAWDTLACVESLIVATATGLFRIIGDRHYATDVIAGAVLGFSIGYLLPWLFHYRYGPDLPEHTVQASGLRSPFEFAPPIGLQLGGTLD